MTTKVTVKTHTWPVAVTENNSHSHNSDTTSSYGHSSTTHFVPANSEREFIVTSTQSLSFSELPEDATSLNSGTAAAEQAVEG